MKAAIKFIEPDNKRAILTRLLDIIQGIEQLRQHVLTHGILLENLTPSEVEVLKEALRKLDYSDYTATENSLRLKIAGGDLSSLIRLVITIPGFGNDFAEMFWERGFSIEKLTPDQAEDLKRQLEPIAIVTITPDIADTPESVVYTVSGQVRRQDNTPFNASGFTVHAFDSVSPNNFVELGSVALSPQASYHLSYPWRPNGRSGPNLVVRLLNPKGETVAEVHHSLAPTQAVLNITVKNPQPQSFVLTTSVKNQVTGETLADVQVEAQFRANNSMLQTISGTTNSEGVALIPFDESVFRDVPKGQNVEVVFGVHQEGQAVETNTTIPNLQLKNQEVEILTVTLNPSSNVVVGGNRIKGTIFLEYGVPAMKLKLRLYRRDFGGKETQLSETFTSNDGQYAFAYSAGSKTGSLEIRAVKGESEEIPLSRPLNDLGKESDSLLTLIAPAILQPAEAEYQRLSADLIPHVEQMRNLAEARENKERQDITVLNRATGWDARLIALAATAERLNADAEVNLPPEPLYGLLRAGLPSEKLMLAQVSPDVAEQALKVVRDKGIVQLTDDQIGQFKKEFVAFSNETRLSIPAPGSHSTYRELLQISRLGDDAQNKFASAYLNYHGDPTGLWEEVRKAGLDDTQISKLQLQGKLAFLAANSREMTVSLMNRLANNEAVRDPVQLVEQDFYEADQWKREITKLAGNDQQKLAALIPAAYISEKLDDRLDAYAEDMGRKLRLSYPTQVVSRMIERDKIKLSAAKDLTAKLLKSAAGQGFRLGETPVETFFKTHTGVTAGMEGDEIDAAKQQIKTLQTVYQITPSNDAMTVLMASSMTSAYHVTAYSQKEFVAKYEREYTAVFNFPPPLEEPLLIYRKARQVSSVTYNLFTIARKIGSDLPVAGMSTPVELLEAARSEIIKHFPTMESLFGSMDFCECEHCRSVLSPAAYLVDLLQFIDTEPQLWDDFLREWSEKHNGQEYPHKGKNGLALKAYDVLVERRPDLPHIPLTCENTHTVLPYIDIVNEILEYYVANGRLAEEATRDTGGATTQDLLAEPQNVIREAYDKLDEARYPLKLPFDLWLETVRQFCNYFDAPLEGILDIFRSSDDLFAPAQPFDRNNIFIESLGISPAEWAIFTATDHLVDGKWYELYGLLTLRPAIETSTNDGQGIIAIANDAAGAFREGFACAYFDVSAVSLSNESNIILTIGEADSGGPSLTSITFKNPWTTSPDRGDLLVLDAAAILKSAKTLSRRLGVTYKEIVEIIQTGFVNPKLADFAILDKVGVSIGDVLLHKDFKQLLDYQHFALQTGTAMQETDARFEFLLAENGDLFALKKSGTNSGKTEIHVLSASSKYQEFLLHTETGLHETDDTFEFLLAKNRDLFAIKKSGADSDSTEIHVLSAASQYQTFSLHTETALHETDTRFEFLLAENGDLFAIKKRGTDSNSTEIHVLSASSKYLAFSLHAPTTLQETNDTFTFLLAMNRDLLAIKKSETESNSTEVRVLSAASGYQQFSLKTGTALHETGATFEFLLAENSNIFAVKKSGTGSNSTEVHVLVGPNGLEETDRRRYESLKAFENRISRFEKSTGFDVKNWLNDSLENKAFDDVILLVDPDAGCNFDLTTLRYASGRPADAIVFLKINLFVRLWRKLGWSIEETNRALRTFIPKNAPFDKDPGNLGKQPLKTALIYLAHLKFMDEKLRLGKHSHFKLIPLWRDMGTDAGDSLYAQLFLTPALLKSGAVEVVVDGKKSNVSIFDSPIGRYLDPSDLRQMSEQVHYEVSLQNIKNENKIEETLFAGKPRLSLRYDELAEVQYLSYVGTLTEQEKQDLIAIARSEELITLLDAVQAKATEFMLVRGHILTLQGALGLTADEIRQILADAGHSMETAPLSLPVVSLLYRYGLLAKALKLPVNELITLKQLSGLDPFKPLNGDPLSTLSEDNPYTQTLRFVEIVEEVKDSGLTIEDLNYLLRHRFDETGKYRPTTGITLAFIKTIGEGVRAIRTEHAMPSDLAQLSEEVLRQKLVLALAPDVVERFLAMVNGTVEFTSARPGVDAMNTLNPEQFSSESRIRQISYKEVPEKEQKLTLRGVLFATEKADLEARVGTALSMDQQSVLSDLLEGVRAKAREFFDNNFKKQPLKPDGGAGFFDETDFDVLFRHLKEPQKIEPDDTEEIISAKKSESEKIEQENQKDLEARRFHIAQVFLPFLQQRLIRQFVTQTLTGHTGADRVLVESLLNDARLLGTTKPLLESFTAADVRGITATFSAAPDGTGPALATVFLPEADTAFKDQDGNFLKPAEANSARFEGYLEVPVPGAYRFYVKLEKQDAEAELRFAHLPSPLPIGTAMANSDEVDIGYSEFQPGLPYRFTLDLRKLNGGHARVWVQGETLPKRSLSQLILYPLVTVDQAEKGLLLLTKTLQLLHGFGLSEREACYLLTHGAAFENLDFNKLPSRDAQSTLEMLTGAKREASPDLSKQEALELTRAENPSLAAEADHPSQLFKQFLRLASYVRLKRDLAGNTDDLIEIFEANEAAEPTIGEKLDKKIYPLIAMLTRRDPSTVKITAKILFGDSPVFASEIPLQRLWDALQVIEKFGVPAVSVRDWTRIVSAAAPPAQRFEIARNLKEALKARFDREAWQRIAQPIFDKLRQRQRDALASHIMHQQGFSRVEQLYEYFLIDPGMEPVVQTSRIRLAISSIQLFIQRCLLNLEIKVNPSVINAKQWEWMKRYRVWEANRKIFLFPENWLEPEFREDKTHLFQEMEGALLQGDVSSDLVEDAFLNYLRKLDELARLNIVAMHIEDNADRTLHVFGRTFSGPHKYFYRRYIHQMWTPWEPVRAEIQGDHLAPIVWRDRLYLFWVTFMDMPHENAPTGSITSGTPLINADLQSLMSDLRAAGANKQINIQLHWSENLNGEWSTSESSELFLAESAWLIRPLSDTSTAGDPILWVMPVVVPFDFNTNSVFVHVSKAYEAGEERGVYIHLSEPINKAFHLAGRNSPLESTVSNPKPNNPYSSANTILANRYTSTEQFKVSFQDRITSEAGEMQPTISHVILQQHSNGYTLLPCDNMLATSGTEIAPLTQPVFYQDNANTFFIEPSLTERTVEEWQEWILPPPQFGGGGSVIRDEWWDSVTPAFPEGVKDPRPDVKMPPILVNPESLIKLRESHDWLVNSGTGLIFDDVLLGPKGQSGLEIVPLEGLGKRVAIANQIKVKPGSGVAPDKAVIVSDVAVAGQFDQIQMAKGMNVIGSSGFNSAMMTRNSGNFNSLGLSTGTVNAKQSFIR